MDISFKSERYAAVPRRDAIEKDGNEFHSWSPELPGCHSHDKTVKEAMDNLKDAIQLYLETRMEEDAGLK